MLSFAAYSRFIAVAAVNGEIVVETHDGFVNRRKQPIIIPARQVSTADRPAKQAVACEDDSFCFLGEHSVPERGTIVPNSAIDGAHSSV